MSLSEFYNGPDLTAFKHTLMCVKPKKLTVASQMSVCVYVNEI